MFLLYSNLLEHISLASSSQQCWSLDKQDDNLIPNLSMEAGTTSKYRRWQLPTNQLQLFANTCSCKPCVKVHPGLHS